MTLTLRNGLALLFVVILAIVGWTRSGQAAETSTKPQLTVFVADAVPPKMFVKNGKPAGYILEIALEAVRRAGYVAEVRQVPFARALNQTQAGDGVLPGMSFTEERAKLFLFSQPMYEGPVLLVTLAGHDFPFSGLQDLAGRSIGINRGSHYGAALDAARASFTAEEDGGTEMRLRKLQANHIDGAIVSGGPAAIRFAAETIGADPKSFVARMPPISIDKNFFGVAKSRPDAAEILGRLDPALASMWADGTIATITAAYE